MLIDPDTCQNDSSDAAEKHTFQAETKQLLNIVANSLYTDKHVFVRLVADRVRLLRVREFILSSICRGVRINLSLAIPTPCELNTTQNYFLMEFGE